MKKFISVIAAAIVLTCATSCGSRNSHIDVSVSDVDSTAVVVDSVAVVDSVVVSD